MTEEQSAEIETQPTLATENQQRRIPEPKRTLTREYKKDGILRVLSLDGGGAKGFYTLGVLKEIEGMLNCPLYKCFDLVYGTSTGSIIGTLIALGYEVDEIRKLYREHVPKVTAPWFKWRKSAALRKLANEIFCEATFDDVKTQLGVVSTKWAIERPMIFKNTADLAHGRTGTFVVGFGAKLAQAVEASCSAYPFFERPILTLSTGDNVELADGGYCANNPTLYAIADATTGLNKPHKDIRVVSLGVGVYPEPKTWWPHIWCIKKFSPFLHLLQKTMEINSQSMDQLRDVVFCSIPTVRISDAFSQPAMATDFMEHNINKLDILWQRGRESFASREMQLRDFLMEK